MANSMVEVFGEVEHENFLLRPNEWWACQHPERRYEEGGCQFKYTCVKCWPLFEKVYLAGVLFFEFDIALSGFIQELGHCPTDLARVQATRGERFECFMDEDIWC